MYLHGQEPRPGKNINVGRPELIPRQLPPPPALFTGRQHELSLLDLSIRDERRSPSVVMLRGPGGVGKSALGAQWLDRVSHRFHDGQLYAELSWAGGEPVAVEDILGLLLRGLGIPHDRVPERFAERVGLYRSVTAGLSLAILLDDAISAAQVRSLLPSSGASVVVVTTKRPLAGLVAEGAVVVPLRPMEQVIALELLATCVGSDRIARDSATAKELVALCSGLPLAIRVVAALMVLRPRWSTADLVEVLRDERRRLDVLAVEDDLSVRATFDSSYHHLSPAAAFAYRALGVHPGTSACTEMVSTTCGVPPADAQAMLDELVDACLLDDVGHDLQECHDLVHAHARAIAVSELDRTAESELARGVLEWHLAVAQAAGRVVLPARRVVPYQFERHIVLPEGLAEHGTALSFLERHRHDMIAAVHNGVERGWHDLAYALGDALQPLLILHKHYTDAVKVNTLALQSAIALGDRDADTNMRKRLARTYLRLDMFDLAQHHIDELLRVSRQRGDRYGIASGLKSLGGLYSRQNKHTEAVEAFAEAARIARELGAQRREGLTLIDLGRSLLDADRPDEAAAELTRARDLLSTLDVEDRYNSIRALMLLARARLRQGDGRSARQCIEDALPALESIDADVELARAHEVAAEVFAADEPARARDHQRRATEIMSVVSARSAIG